MNRYPLSDSLSHKTINPPPPPPRLDLILALTSTPTGASHAAALATVCDSFARDLHAVHLSYRALLARLAWSDAPPPLSPPHTARRALGSLHVDALRAKLAAGVHLSAGFAVGILHREIERLVLSGCKRIVVSGVEIVQESEGEDGVGGLRVLALLETKVARPVAYLLCMLPDPEYESWRPNVEYFLARRAKDTVIFPSQIGPCPFSDVAMYRNLLASLFGKAYPVTRGRDERELGAGNSAGGDSTQLVSHLRRV